MKKFILLGLSLVLILSLCSCSKSTSSNMTSYTSEDGTRVLESDSGSTFLCDSIPYDIPYNETFVTFEGIDFYEDEVDYSHHLYAVITLDVSNLDDSQLHWLVESDLSAWCFLSHEKNKYDNYYRTTSFFEFSDYLSDSFSDSVMNFEQAEIDGQKKIILLFTSNFDEENRYSFSGADLHLRIDIKQDETYTHKSSDGEDSVYSKSNELSYTATVPSEISAFYRLQRYEPSIYSAISGLLEKYK